MNKIKAVFYGINGTGLGHLSRLLNIAREAKILLNSMDLGADFHFISTSEAPQIAWDFPVYKIPSKTIIAPSDTPNQNYAANAQFFISNLMAMLKPELLLMDTLPQGSFGEFFSLKAFAKKKVFINRHKNDEYGASELHQSMLPLYDLILTPSQEDEHKNYHIPDRLKEKHFFTGPIHSFKETFALSRKETRAYFGIKDSQKLLYLSAGGGGDKSAEQDLEALIEGALQVPDVVLLIAYGPLYRGKRKFHPRVLHLSEAGVSKYFQGLDAAISAAGYNTFQELLAARVPSSFFAQQKGMDLQDLRIRNGSEAGWNRELINMDTDSVKEEVEKLLDEEEQNRLRKNLDDRPRSEGGLKAAVECLKLHKSIPQSPIRYSEIFLLALWRKHWLEQAKKLHMLRRDLFTPEFISESMKYALHLLKTSEGRYPLQQLYDKAQFSWHSEGFDLCGGEFLLQGLHFVHFKREQELSERRIKLLISQFLKDADRSRMDEHFFENFQAFAREKLTPTIIPEENT